jgi:mannose-6-phosphate isomerase-like protein (cupin superfamily)
MMATMPDAPRITRIEDIQPLAAFASAGVNYRLVRRTLGIRAFGVNAFTADAGEQLIEEHDEMGSGAGRHEELYVVISGRARFVIDGVEHDAPAGTLLFVPDPSSRRIAHALDDGTSAMVVGGAPGQAYELSPWEASVAAKDLADAGDPGGAADLMGEALAELPDNAYLLYNAACFEALAGRREDALAHLRAAVERDPKTREWAAGDSDLDSIRDDPEYP